MIEFKEIKIGTYFYSDLEDTNMVYKKISSHRALGDDNKGYPFAPNDDVLIQTKIIKSIKKKVVKKKKKIKGKNKLAGFVF